jgi:DNA-binding SARP family transcriptional activator/TolB-like protein
MRRREGVRFADKIPINPRLTLSVLGVVQVAVSGRPVQLRSRKCKALLAYLALAEGGGETRERLGGLLWSESGEPQARASLRQIVHELREALGKAGFDGLHAGRLCLELDRDRVHLDLGEVIAAAESGGVHSRLLETPRLAETLLKDYDDLDPSFRAWLLARRQAVHQRLLRSFELRLRAAAGADREPPATALLRLDPTHEEACRALMRGRAEAGDVAAALYAYRLLWTVLDEEYGMEPSAATQRLVAEIKQGRLDRLQPERAGRRPGLAGAPQAALLVETFGLIGVDPDRVPLVEGLRHNLIARLVGLRGWSVLDPSARAGAPASDAIGAAGYAIEATAIQAGSRIDVVLTMRRRDAQLYVWSERFELQLATWFAAQQRIVRRVALSLNLRLPDGPVLPVAALCDRAADRWPLAPPRARRRPGLWDRDRPGRVGWPRRPARRGRPA